MVVGQTLGQCVNPKNRANGVPFSSALDRRLPSCVVSSNGPPMPAASGSRPGTLPKLGRKR